MLFTCDDIELNSGPKKGAPAAISHLPLWRRGVMVINTVQLHSSKPELRFCACSNPARGVSEMVRISGDGPSWK